MAGRASDAATEIRAAERFCALQAVTQSFATPSRRSFSRRCLLYAALYAEADIARFLRRLQC